MKRLSIFLILFLLASFATGQEIISQGSLDLTPTLRSANLTSENAALFFGDDLRQTTGSDSLNSANVAEGINAYQGTLSVILQPAFDSNSATTQYIADAGFLELYWDGNNTRWTATINGATITASDTFIAGAEIFLHVTWDSKIPELDFELDGSAETTITSAQTVVAPNSTLQIAANESQALYFNGLFKYRVSEEIEPGYYNAAAGDVDFLVVTPATLMVDNFSDGTTSKVGFHKGSTVSDITDYTLTTPSDAQVRFTAADEGALSDATGYNRPVVMPTITDATTVEVEGSGDSVDCDGQYYSNAANNTIHDVTTEDISFSCWVFLGASLSQDSYFVSKSGGSNGYRFFIESTNGRPDCFIRDAAGDQYRITGNQDLRDGKWHHVAIVFDRDTDAECQVFVDGVAISTSKSGTLADVDSITSTNTFTIGSRATTSFEFDGKLSDAKIYIAAGAIWSDAEIAYQAANPFDVSASAGTITDSWSLNEGAGTTINGAVNNLTLSNAAAWARGVPDPDIERVGVFAELNGTSHQFSRSDADFPESGITGANDLTIQGWVKRTVFASTDPIVSKYTTSGDMRMYRFLINAGGEMVFGISSDGTAANLTEGATVALNIPISQWHHVAVVYDASAGTVDFYFDGIFISQGAGLKNSIADKSPDFEVGHRPGGNFFGGGLSNVALFDDKRTAAEILTSATNPKEDLSAAGNIIGQWMFDDAASVTRIANTQLDTGRDLNLVGGTTTNYGTHTRTQEAFISRNHLADPGAENGGIGGWTAGDAATTISKSTAQIDADTQSLKILNGDASQAFARQTLTTVASQDYLFRGRFFAPTTPNGASRLVDVDATAALGITVTQAGLSAGWNDVEFAFTAADTSITIDLGSGSVTNTEFGYWDSVIVMENEIANGGFETFVGGDPDSPTGWIAVNAAAGELAKAGAGEADTERHSGDFCMKWVDVEGAEGIVIGGFSLPNSKYVTVALWAKGDAGGEQVLLKMVGVTNVLSATFTLTTSWAKYSVTFNPGADSTGTLQILRGGGSTFYVDDVTLVRLDTVPADTETKVVPIYPLGNYQLFGN